MSIATKYGILQHILCVALGGDLVVGVVDERHLDNKIKTKTKTKTKQSGFLGYMC
jgi:hypothetical protein